jgi:hypothetical protein
MKYKKLLIICWAVMTAAVAVYAGIGPSRATTPDSNVPDRNGDLSPSSIPKEPPSTDTASFTLLGNPILLYGTGTSMGWACGNPPPDYDWFDGPVAPVSYRNPPTSNTTTVSLFAPESIGGNRQLVGTLNANNTITGMAPPNSTASYRSHFHPELTQSFQWSEWLYGGFFNAGTKKLYSFIYNEWHGLIYPDPCANPANLGADGSWYTAMGLATSTNFGATVSQIAPAPAHIVARATFGPSPNPQPYNKFIGMAGTTLLLSPKDNRFYAFEKFSNVAHTIDNATYLMRTDNLDDPQSWRIWDGTGFNAQFYPPSSPPGWDGTVTAAIDTHGLAPLYLGWSKYFQRFIAVGWYPPLVGLDTPAPSTFAFSLSDDLVHWDPAIRFFPNPPSGPGFDTTYPSLVDPSMLQAYTDSRAASNNYTGQTPYLTYVRHYGATNSELVMQQLQFSGGPVPPAPPAVLNISIRGVVRPGDGALIAGFEIGPGNPKTIIIRGLGPSQPGGLNAPTLGLYSSTGLIKSNFGWSNNSSTDLALMSVVLPTVPGDCALVYGNFTPGFYTVVLSGGSTGTGQIELYDVTLQSTTPSLNSKLKSFSARGYVSPTGPMTMGFILGATRSGVLRATSLSTLPPSLSPRLPDPMLTLNNYVGGFNDNWMTDPNHVAIQASGHAPGNPLEAAIYPSMGANSWTTTVTGHSGQEGYTLVEFFDCTNGCP